MTINTPLAPANPTAHTPRRTWRLSRIGGVTLSQDEKSQLKNMSLFFGVLLVVIVYKKCLCYIII